MLNVSGSEYVFLLVFYIAMGVLGYSLAEADRRNLGRTPWGIRPVLWGLIWFLTAFLGLVLWAVAHRSEVRRAAQTPFGPVAAPPTVTNQPVRTSASDFPAYPRRADGGPRDTSGPPPQTPVTPAAPAPGSAGPVPAEELSPPAWHPDPSGRYHYRWWTGSEWTSYVSTHGHVEVDTNPDQRIGPYS